MYVTRPLSLYNRSPSASSAPPPEGPGSGVLVREDEEPEAQARCCWGLCRDTQMYQLPFPQNRKMQIRYTDGQNTYCDDVFCIPVIGEPLSSNRYYIVRAGGRHEGYTSTCSKEEDMGTCCWCRYVNDVKPMPFDHTNIYQQVEIVPRRSGFTAKAAAADGFSPRYLKRKGWQIYTSKLKDFDLREALGVDAELRARMPDLEFDVSTTKQSPPVVVGKWYCPFIFVKEGDALKDQMKRSLYYEMTLEQFWEEIYGCQNHYREAKDAKVSVSVRKEVPLLNGGEVAHDGSSVVNDVIWFRPVNSIVGGLGLSLVVWEKMMWEMERGGWEGGKERVVRVERVDECGEKLGWNKFGCYVLVERFVLKRMDGSLAFTYDFKHTSKIRTKWE